MNLNTHKKNRLIILKAVIYTPSVNETVYNLMLSILSTKIFRITHLYIVYLSLFDTLETSYRNDYTYI